MFARMAFVFALLASAAAQAGDLQVTEAWARASGGRTQSAAAYLTVTNKGSEEDRLTSVATPLAKTAMLHKEDMAPGNVMTMTMVDFLIVPAGKSVTLEPGKFHVMLMQLDHPIKEGDSFPLTLTFAKAGEIKVDVAVQGVGAKTPGARHHDTNMPGANDRSHRH